MATGALSYSKARALTRIANAENAQDLLDIGLAGTSNHVERVVSAYRRCAPSEEAAEAIAHAARGVSIRQEGATTMFTIRVPTESGAAVAAAMDRFRDDSDTNVSLSIRRADAVVAMAEHACATQDQPPVPDDRYLVTLHLTPDVFDDEPADTHDPDAPSEGQGRGLCCVAPGDGLSEDPVGVPRVSARRILCDAVMQGFHSSSCSRDHSLHNDGDECDDCGTLRLGYTQRVVSRRLKRALRLRDGGCRFPGCDRPGWVDAHHIQHWLDLGPTNPENLVCLCRAHHRLMHEGQWTISGNANGELSFHRPDGEAVAAEPARVLGTATPVDAHDRTAADGRCAWLGERLDLGLTISTILHNQANREARHTN